MTSEKIEELSYSQRERLAFIDFRAYFLGEVRRADITDHFGVATAAATRDIALYREHAPANIQLDQKTKVYRTTTMFEPLFHHPVDRVLAALSQGFSEGMGKTSRPLIPCEIHRPLNVPPLGALAPISRAIFSKRAIAIEYQSYSSGRTWREIVPFALVNNGLRWHVRCYCRKRQVFLDLVFTRVVSVDELENAQVLEHETPDKDIQWSRIVELEMVPHPQKPMDLETIKLDYGMQDGVLRMNVRAALVGYYLQQWFVDCSPNAALNGPEHRLWLKNYPALYGVENSKLAPGYQQEVNN